MERKEGRKEEAASEEVRGCNNKSIVDKVVVVVKRAILKSSE